jgi:hypothetical protein
LICNWILFAAALLHVQVKDVQCDRQGEVEAKGGDRCISQRIARSTAEGCVCTATAATECLRQSATLRPLDQNDQDEAD